MSFITVAWAQNLPGFKSVETNPYAVKGITVEARAENAVLAREKAFAQALEKGFVKMLEQLEPDASRRSAVSVPSAAELGQMLQDFSAANEKVSPTQYAATFEVWFRAARVQKYLHSPATTPAVSATTATSAMTPVTTPSSATAVVSSIVAAPSTPQTPVAPVPVDRPALLLNYYQTAKGLVLWSTPNPLREMLNRADNLPPLIKIPLGDLTDMQVFDEQAGLKFNAAQLVALLHKYDLSDALIVVAVEDTVQNAAYAQKIAPSKMTLMFYQAGIAAPTPRFLESAVLAVEASSTPDELYNKSVAHIRIQTPVLLARMSRDTTASAADLTLAKSNPTPTTAAMYTTPVSEPSISVTAATAPSALSAGQYMMIARAEFKTLTEWQAIRARLAAVPVVKSVRVARLRSQEAGIELMTTVPQDVLMQILAEQGILMSPDKANGAGEGVVLTLTLPTFESPAPVSSEPIDN